MVILRRTCDKRPANWRYLVWRHAGETGVLVHAWKPLLRISGPDEWVFTPVFPDEGESQMLVQSAKRTVWLPLSAGEHTIQIGDNLPQPTPHLYRVNLMPRQISLIVFSTPRWSVSGRFARPIWCEPITVAR